MMTVVMGLGQGRLKSVAAQRRPPYGTWMPGSRERLPHQSRGAGAAATGAEAGGGRRCENGRCGCRRLFLDFLIAGLWRSLMTFAHRGCEARLGRWIACPGRTNGGSKHPAAFMISASQLHVRLRSIRRSILDCDIRARFDTVSQAGAANLRSWRYARLPAVSA
jgi:hypothetical protein